MSAETANNEESFGDYSQTELDYGANPAGYSAFYDELAGEAPAVTFDPPHLSVLTADEEVQVTITNLAGITSLLVWVEWADGATEVAYAHPIGGVSWTLESSSTGVEGTTVLVGLVRDLLLRGAFTLRVEATDFRPFTVRSTASYTVAPAVAAPVLQNVVPADGSTIQPTDVIGLEVDAQDALAAVTIVARYADADDLVFDAGGFAPRFAAGSSVVENTSKHWTFIIARDPSWVFEDMSLRVVAEDVEWRTLTSTSINYTVDVEPEEAGDVTPPEVTGITPAPGQPLGKFQEVQLEVRDASKEFHLLEVQVDQTVREVAYDGASFLYPYKGSAWTFTADGVLFTIRRTGGWSLVPRFRVRAIDANGNQVGVPVLVTVP
jgi:hypothetical protein